MISEKDKIKLKRLLAEAFWEIYIIGWLSAMLQSATNRWKRTKCLTTDFFILTHNNVLNILDNCGEALHIRRGKINLWRNIGAHHFKGGVIICDPIELYENYKLMSMASGHPYIMFDWNYSQDRLNMSDGQKIRIPISVKNEMSELMFLVNKNRWKLF